MNERENRVREIAHRLWEEEGRPPDQEKRHWDEAERTGVRIRRRAVGTAGNAPDRKPADSAKRKAAGKSPTKRAAKRPAT